MKSFKITFLALSRGLEFEISSENSIDQILNDFLLIFATEVDYDNFNVKIEMLQQNTEAFRVKLNEIIDKYKGYEPKIQQLKSYFQDLKNDEYFFIFPNANITKEQSFQYYNYLSAIEKGDDYNELTKQIDGLFAELMSQYEIFAFDESTRKKIGEPDKTKRICRFCGKGSEEETFRKVAHSISEALGNKKIITNDECDSCNEKFGSGIENDLILYLNLYRNVFGIKGKNGVPKLKGKNIEIENNGTIEIKQVLTDEELNDPNRDDLKVKMESFQTITIQNIYRSLSKYALGVIDAGKLESFKETINWINGEFEVTTLPKVAMLKSFELFSHHPKIVVYIRKNKDQNLPYCVAEFRFTFLSFVYIIPHSSEDNCTYLREEDYNRFWEFFKHYSSVEDWSFKRMDDNQERKFVVNLNFDVKKPD